MAGLGRGRVGPYVCKTPDSAVTQASTCHFKILGPQLWAEATAPGGILTHGLVKGQEALVGADGPILRGGGCMEGQLQPVSRGHKLLLTRGTAQRGSLLPTEPACIHSTGCDLKGERGESAAQEVTGWRPGHGLQPCQEGLLASGALKPSLGEPSSGSCLFHY